MTLTTTENTEGGFYLTYHSKSKEVSELTSDLEKVLEYLNSKALIDAKQILFYIDATNGNVYISGFKPQTGDFDDDKGIWIQLQALWDDNDAADFDEFVIEAIKQSLQTQTGKQSLELFDIYYQTEIDAPEKIG